MESLAKQLKNELKNRLRNAAVDGVDRQDVCVCACLNWNGLHDVVDKFLTEAYFVDTGEHLYLSPPSDLSSNHCSGFGAAMEYPNYIKRLNKYRASENPHVLICDNLCSDVIKEFAEKQRAKQSMKSLKSFFNR
ncbi:MAG: hypothetical protein IJ165_03590 [Proteobacteria bacterium]|nr:hypothetical protein [Pseudomonadota bacterium]